MRVVHGCLALVEHHGSDPSFVVIRRVPCDDASAPSGFFEEFAMHGHFGTFVLLDASSRELPSSFGMFNQQDAASLTERSEVLDDFDRPRKHEPWQAHPSIRARAVASTSSAHASPLATARRARKNTSSTSPSSSNLSRRACSGSFPRSSCSCATGIGDSFGSSVVRRALKPSMPSRKAARVSTSGGLHGRAVPPSKAVLRRPWYRSRTSRWGLSVCTWS